jgi:predicted dehydrogenase
MNIRNSAVDRRRFLQNFSLATAGCLASPLVFARKLPNHPLLRVAIVGFGNRGEENSKYLVLSGNVSIVSVCDTNSDKLQKAKTLHPHASCFTYLPHMLDRLGRGIDALVIATPDHLHCEATLLALQKNLHVLCEAPLAMSRNEIAEISRAAHGSRKQLQLGFFGQHLAGEQWVADTLTRKELGRIHTIHIWNKPACATEQKRTNWQFQLTTGGGDLGLNGMSKFRWLPLFQALEVEQVKCVVGQTYSKQQTNADPLVAYPNSYILQYRFHNNQMDTPLDLYWYQGTMLVPQVSRALSLAKTQPGEGGMLWEGTKGSLLFNCNSEPTALLKNKQSYALHFPYKDPTIAFKSHLDQWIASCQRDVASQSELYDQLALPTSIVVEGNQAIFRTVQTL